MAYRKTVAVLVLDAQKKKCSFNGGPWINLKGCVSMKRFQEIVEQQKKEDEKKGQDKRNEGERGGQGTQPSSVPPGSPPPSSPAPGSAPPSSVPPSSVPPEPPTDRDGYWVCDQGTWHFCTTYPPYEVYDTEVPC